MAKEIIFILALLVGGDVWASQEASRLWTKKMRGAVSDLSVSKDGKFVLVATSPDSDIEGSARQYLLSKWDISGNLKWEIQVKQPTRAIDISKEGSLVLAANYGNRLVAMDEKGKTLWTVEAMCRPQILETAKKILCYHDDDAEPEVGFDLFDWKGKKLASHPIKSDILALKLSEDERNLAIGLAEGGVTFFNPDFQPLWEKKVEGEVIDVAVSSGESPKIAVLYKTKNKTQEIAVFDQKGNRQTTLTPSFRAIQLEIAPQGAPVFYYGNSTEGQYLGSSVLNSSQEAWKKGGVNASDYSYSIQVGSGVVLMGYEEITQTHRNSHLMAYDFEGKLKWDLILARDEGAYIYTHRVAAKASTLVIGTDDARVSLFRF